MTPNQEAIAALRMSGVKDKQIADSLGRHPRVISQIMKGEKPYNNLTSQLASLARGSKVSKEELASTRRKTKSGKVAGTRKLKSFTTKKGKQQTAARGVKVPASLKKAIGKSAGKGLRWDINFKQIMTKSKVVKNNKWISGQLPSGWTAQDLQGRINNPQEGDNWKAGDVNGALVAIALEQNEGSVVSASGAQEFSLFSTE